MILIQARLGSSRFPGKILANIYGKPLIGRVLDACAASSLHSVIVCCLPFGESASPVGDLIRANFPSVFISEGPERDVFSRIRLGYERFVIEAEAEPAAAGIVRVCADRPLLQSSFLDSLNHEEFNEDFLFNHDPRPELGPIGLGAESLSRELARRFFSQPISALSENEVEHVTPGIYQDKTVSKRLVFPRGYPIEGFTSNLRFDVDEEWHLDSLPTDSFDSGMPPTHSSKGRVE